MFTQTAPVALQTPEADALVTPFPREQKETFIKHALFGSRLQDPLSGDRVCVPPPTSLGRQTPRHTHRAKFGVPEASMKCFCAGFSSPVVPAISGRNPHALHTVIRRSEGVREQMMDPY